MWPFTRRRKCAAARLDAERMQDVAERQHRRTMRIMQQTLTAQAEAEQARAKAHAHMKED